MAENVEVSGIQLLVDSGNTEEALSQFKQLLGAANVNVEKFTTVIARMGKESEELTYKVRGVTTAGHEVNTTITKTADGFAVASVQVRNMQEQLDKLAQKQAALKQTELISKAKAAQEVANLTRIDQELQHLIKNFNIINSKQIKLGIPQTELDKIRKAETAILNLVAAGKITHKELLGVYTAIRKDANTLFVGINANVAEHIRTIAAGIQKVEDARRRLATQVAAANKAEKILGPQVSQASTKASQAELANYTKKLNEYKNAAADAQVKARQLTDAWKAAQTIAAGGAVNTKRWSEEKKKLVQTIVALISAQKQLGAATEAQKLKQFASIQAAQIQMNTMRALGAEATKLKAVFERLNARQINLGIRPDQLNVIKQAQAQLLNLVSTGKLTTAQLKSIFQTMQKDSATVFYGVANQAAQQFRRIENALNGVKTTNDIATKQIFISWRTIGRFFVSHILYAGFYRMLGAIQTGIRDTVEFKLRIDEIRTLTQRTGETFQVWSDRVRELSDLYGRDLKDVAEGAYETISNQVADAALATTFLSEALNFSKAAVANTEDSVNLLSSAINSFQMTTLETDRIAASFFKTIDLGRVRASEMADTFGRVGSLGNNLGLSLDEVNAAIATLTVQGIRYNEAFTLITNVMIKLLKPTTAMKELFKEWGVETGEAAISTYGWIGVLALLEKESEKGASRLGELASRIRAVRGIAGLAGNESVFENYTNALDEIINSLDEYEKAVNIISKSTGQIWKEEANKIKNYFTVDLAGTFVDTLININRASDGTVNLARNAIAVFDTLIKISKIALAAAAASLIVKTISTGIGALAKIAHHYEVATRAVQVYGNTSAITLGRVAIVSQTTAVKVRAATAVMATAYKALVANIQLVATVLTTVAIAAIFKWSEKHKQYIDEVTDSFDKAVKNVENNSNRLTLIDKKEALAEMKEMQETVKNSSRITMFFLKTVFDEYQDNLIDMGATEKQLGDKINSYIKARLDAYKEYFTGLETAISDLDKKIDASLTKLETVKATREESDFARSLKLAGSPQEQLKLLEAKILEQDAEASELEAKGLYSSAEKTRDRIEDLIEQAKTLASDLGTRVTTYTDKGEKLYKTTKQLEIENKLSDVIQNQDAFLKNQAENYTKQRDLLIDIARLEQERLKTLTSIAEKISETTENAGKGSPEDILNRSGDIGNKLKEFQEFSKLIGSGLSVDEAVGETREQILDQIDALEQQRQQMYMAGESATSFKADLNGLAEVSEKLNEAWAKLDGLDETVRDIQLDPALTAQLQELLDGDPLANVEEMAKEIPTLFDAIQQGFTQALQSIPKEWRDVFEQITGQSVESSKSIGDLQNIYAQYTNNVTETQGKALEDMVQINNELNNAKGYLEALIPLLTEAQGRIVPLDAQLGLLPRFMQGSRQSLVSDPAYKSPSEDIQRANEHAIISAEALKEQMRQVGNEVNAALLEPVKLTDEQVNKIQQKIVLLQEALANAPKGVRLDFDAEKMQKNLEQATQQLDVFYKRLADKKSTARALDNFGKIGLELELLNQLSQEQLQTQESIRTEFEGMPKLIEETGLSITENLNKSLDETLAKISQIRVELDNINRESKNSTRDFEKKLSIGNQNVNGNVGGVRFTPQTNNTKQTNNFNVTLNVTGGVSRDAKTNARELVKEINTGLRLGHYKLGV